MTCSLPSCERPAYARSWCSKHYARWYRTGRADEPSFDERFWARVEKTRTCWLWTGGMENGYGRLRRSGHLVLAHRVAYEAQRGAVPEGLTLDHICRVRHCVNPDHLQPVSTRVNILRGIAIPAINARKSHCQHGHPFTPENTVWEAAGRRRRCRACKRAYGAAWARQRSRSNDDRLLPA